MAFLSHRHIVHSFSANPFAIAGILSEECARTALQLEEVDAAVERMIGRDLIADCVARRSGQCLLALPTVATMRRLNIAL